MVPMSYTDEYHPTTSLSAQSSASLVESSVKRLNSAASEGKHHTGEFINVNWLPLRKFSQTFTNPLIPMSDQDRISPYNINTILTR